MLEIVSSGGSSVKISTKNDTLWIDPALRHTADKVSELKNAVQLATLPQLLQAADSDQARLEGPGEYEAGPFAISGFAVKAFSDDTKVTSYRVEVKEVMIGVLANGVTELDENQLEQLGLVDVLILPVTDGVVGPDAHRAAQLVRRIEPKVVLPIGVSIEDTTQEPASDELAAFVKELGAATETGGRFKIKSLGDIPASLTVYLPQ